MTDQMEERKSGGCLRSIIELVVVVAVAFGLAFFVTTFVAQPYEIPSGSMEDTIQIGDKVFSEKVTQYTSDPKQGDIVTFKMYEDATTDGLYAHVSDAPKELRNRLTEKVLIKRVIAVAGQTVTLKGGKVYVDGTELDEPYTEGKVSEPLVGSSVVFPYTVPEGEVWVMGDNRTDSRDSRWFGSVPIDQVTGHAFFRYWPLDRIGLLD